MVKPLAFKGEKTNKKRKAVTAEDNIQSQKKTRESLADTQEDDHWVTADAVGDISALSAQTEAMSYEETFACIATPDTPGTFNLQTQREKLVRLTDDCNNVRGDAESISFNTTVRVRMQARFKLRLKANKESKAKEKISRKDLVEAAGRKLDDNEVRALRKARIQGDYHEKLLLLRSKGKHDKYA
ncbi:MAG: hypothetical protein LQ344_001807 [Seirophora lacunosa]|nr:MAG: hypothetical protein LQ344_001807 [Seirophora lacunosa]